MEILLGLILSVIAGLIPAIIYSWFIYWLDRHEKEPWWLLALAFLWGAIPAVVMALVAQIILDVPTTWVLSSESLVYDVVGGSIWAPVTEEITKGLGVLLIVLLARREFDSILDGIVYGAMAGIGFAFSENIFYFIGSLVESGFGGWVFTVLLRTIPFGLNHAFFSGVFGAGVAYGLHTRNPGAKVIVPIIGLCAAMIFHGLHNLGASISALNCFSIVISLMADWGGMLILGLIIGLIWQQEKAWMVDHLSDELTPEMYRLVTSWRRWQHARNRALLHADFGTWRHLGRLRQAGAELAFKKQQQVRA
ncbi:MAG: PrsW family intramembrane metalloprotease, partial [Anaerolineae bacterium]|nr:PrsW family intramembrane metalloprotease [Anaerolineae bacterium]